MLFKNKVGNLIHITFKNILIKVFISDGYLYNDIIKIGKQITNSEFKACALHSANQSKMPGTTSFHDHPNLQI